MIDRSRAVFTQNNNVIGTMNVLFSIKKKFGDQCHLVKRGTMGEYGTPNIDIEEGYITITQMEERIYCHTPSRRALSVNQLAALVTKAGEKLGLQVQTTSVPNPRVEAEEHYYNAKHTTLFSWDLNHTFRTLYWIHCWMLRNCSTNMKINFLRYEQSSQCKTMRDSSVSYASAAAKVDA